MKLKISTPKARVPISLNAKAASPRPGTPLYPPGYAPVVPPSGRSTCLRGHGPRTESNASTRLRPVPGYSRLPRCGPAGSRSHPAVSRESRPGASAKSHLRWMKRGQGAFRETPAGRLWLCENRRDLSNSGSFQDVARQGRHIPYSSIWPMSRAEAGRPPFHRNYKSCAFRPARPPGAPAFSRAIFSRFLKESNFQVLQLLPNIACVPRILRLYKKSLRLKKETYNSDIETSLQGTVG